jgi:hypothetical protein
MRRNISSLPCNARHPEASRRARQRSRAFALAEPVARGVRGRAAVSGRAGVRVRARSAARDVIGTRHRAEAMRVVRRRLGAHGDARIAHDVHRAHRILLGARERPCVNLLRRRSHGLLPSVVTAADAIDRHAIGVATAFAQRGIGPRVRTALCRRARLGLRQARICCRDRMRRLGACEEQHGQKGSGRHFEKSRTIVPVLHRRDRIYGTHLRCET